MIKPVCNMLHITSPIHLFIFFNYFLNDLKRNCIFGVKSLKSELFQNWKSQENFKYVANICMHRCIMHIYIYRFDDSSINSVGIEGYCYRTEGWTDSPTETARQKVIHNPLFSLKNAGITKL